MKTSILAIGSRGDVQPFIAIAQQLQKRGITPKIITNTDHIHLVKSYGLQTEEIPLNLKDLMQRSNLGASIEGGSLVHSFNEMRKLAEKTANMTLDALLNSAQNSDCIVTNFGTVLLADSVAKSLGIPLIQAFNVPLTYSKNFPGALLPQLECLPFGGLISHWISREALWMTNKTCSSKAIKRTNQAARFPIFSPTDIPGFTNAPLLYGLSKHLLKLESNGIMQTGFWYVEEAPNFEPPEELRDFLENGPPPVAIGFGSMHVTDPQGLSKTIANAIRESKKRAVILSGWGNLNLEQKDICVIKDIPHSWLFKRCESVVHHCGAGTTAAVLAAGVPSIAVPFHGDQPFWAQSVFKAGLAPKPIPAQKLNAQVLSKRILEAGDEAIRNRCRSLASLIEGERGSEQAAEAIIDCLSHKS